MQSRQPIHFIDVSRINATKNAADSFLLFNLLTSQRQPDISTGPHEFGDRLIALSHPLKRIDPSLAERDNASHYYEIEGGVGRIYALAIGICYYEPLALAKISKITDDKIEARLNALLNSLLELCPEKYPFLSPLHLDLMHLENDRNDLAEADDPELATALFENRLKFYQARMDEVQHWKPARFSANDFTRNQPPDNLIDFIASTAKIDYFPHQYTYPFQGALIRFRSSFVKRFRQRKNDECFDFLEENPMAGDDSVGIYLVNGLFDPKHKKDQPKHKRIYKVSTFNNLNDEFQRTFRLAPYLHARNYQPFLFSERYLGMDLSDYYNDFIFKVYNQEALLPKYILEVLRVSYLAFDGLATVMKGEVHGDIKPENFIVVGGEEILPIDFDRPERYTPIYASPERLNNKKTTAKSDVWSLMRAIARFLGDNHRIWLLDEPKPDNLRKIKAIVGQQNVLLLLKSTFKKLHSYEECGYITRSAKLKLLKLFIQGHQFNPKDRPSAAACAEQFKVLYEECKANLKNNTELSHFRKPSL